MTTEEARSIVMERYWDAMPCHWLPWDVWFIFRSNNLALSDVCTSENDAWNRAAQSILDAGNKKEKA